MGNPSQQNVTVSTDSEKNRIRRAIVLAMGDVDTSKTSWTHNFHLETDAILNISAYAHGNYSKAAKVANAGVTVRIHVDSQLVAADMSFEGESATIDFHASASHSQFVRKGSHQIHITREDNAVHKNLQLCASFYAVAARKLDH